MPLFPFLAGPSQEMWRVVTFDLGIPYTFVHYARLHDEVWISQCSVLWRQEDVLKFCLDVELDASLKILDVWLLLPTKKFNGASWRWVAVNEILVGTVKHSPSAWPYYVTCDGEFIQGGGGNVVERKKNMTKIYVKQTDTL